MEDTDREGYQSGPDGVHGAGHGLRRAEPVTTTVLPNDDAGAIQS
jgi:hypothetical protein